MLTSNIKANTDVEWLVVHQLWYAWDLKYFTQGIDVFRTQSSTYDGMEKFCENSIFAECSILDVYQGSGYADRLSMIPRFTQCK